MKDTTDSAALPDTAPEPTPSIPGESPHRPTHDEIADLAHRLWVESEQDDALTQQNWYHAEEVLWRYYIHATDGRHQIGTGEGEPVAST